MLGAAQNQHLHSDFDASCHPPNIDRNIYEVIIFMYIYAHDKHHTAKMKIIARASSAVANLTARRAARAVPFVCRSREWYKLVNIVRHLLKKRFEATRTVPAASVVYIFMTPYLFGCPIKQCARGADVRAMRIQIAAARVVIV